MRIFFDTNVLIAAFISHGTCKELFEYCITRHTICTSQAVIDEFTEILFEKFKFARHIIDRAVNFLQENLVMISFKSLPSPVCRDPKDDDILASAMNGKVQGIITGDKDLLILKEFQDIPILTPGEFWKFDKEEQP